MDNKYNFDINKDKLNISFNFIRFNSCWRMSFYFTLSNFKIVNMITMDFKL